MGSRDKKQIEYNEYMDNYGWFSQSNITVREHKRKTKEEV